MTNEGNDSEERIEDDETLYRSVWLKPECFYIDEGGALRISGQAFADKRKEPSVFRKHLCDDPPYSNPPRLDPDQAVVSFTAGNIREKASPIAHQSDQNEPPIEYLIDVRPDRSEGQHRSHAIVFATPAFKTNRPFEKLKLRLAQLVEAWAILPDPAFVKLVADDSE